MNPDLVDSHYDFEESDESSDLVGLQIDEVASPQGFIPNSPHSESVTSSLLQGNGSSEYVQLCSQVGPQHCKLPLQMMFGFPSLPNHIGVQTHKMRGALGNNGMGVDKLVENLAKAILSGLDLSDWDTNGDSILDRLLILHSGNAQESGGPADCWSHFLYTRNTVEIGEWEIKHYTISSLESRFGDPCP